MRGFLGTSNSGKVNVINPWVKKAEQMFEYEYTCQDSANQQSVNLTSGTLPLSLDGNRVRNYLRNMVEHRRSLRDALVLATEVARRGLYGEERTAEEDRVAEEQIGVHCTEFKSAWVVTDAQHAHWEFQQAALEAQVDSVTTDLGDTQEKLQQVSEELET